jgi:hypothetical protein
LVVLSAAASAAAAPPRNDFYTSAFPLPPNVQRTGFDDGVGFSNFDATFSRQTPAPPLGEGTFNERYTPAGTIQCEGQQMAATTWFTVRGTGGPITISANSTVFDSIVGGYGPPNNASLGCDDDDGPGTNSRFTFTSTAGADHLVQIGSRIEPDNTFPAGAYSVTALTNDTSAFPETVSAGLYDKSNVGATTTPASETLSCEGTPYNSTVWFRYVAPEYGDVTFHASRFELAVAIYKGGQQVTCDGSSPAVLSASASTKLEAGEAILVQVGGVPQSAGAENQGNFALHVTFARDCNRDGDSAVDANRSTCGGTDCDDLRRERDPGLPEIVNNDLDENCDSYTEFDRDGDGYRVSQPVKSPKPPDWDCDDRPGIGRRSHPDARDVRGNSLNEDCRGRPLPAALVPTGISLSWDNARGGGLKPTLLQLKRLLPGSRVKVSCSGPGCGGRSFDRKFGRAKRKLSLHGRFAGVHVRAGGKIKITVVPPSGEYVGKVRTYPVGRTGPGAAKDSCITARGRRRSCPDE